MQDMEQIQSRIDSFEKMLANGQDSSMLRFSLGNAYWQISQLAKAIEHLHNAVQQQPDYSAAWKILGRVLHDDCQFVSALGAFDEGLKAAQLKGDKQNEKEIGVFRKRTLKQLPDDGTEQLS